MRTRKTLAERFWPKVEKTDGCWIWHGSRSKLGYGRIYNGGKKPYLLPANRAAYLICRGEIPETMCVCHSCDNPRCVNPDHLWLGTHAENMKDMYDKNRNLGPKNRAKGERHGMAKINWNIVNEIRSVQDRRYGYRVKLAKKFGISTQIIERILRNETWMSEQGPTVIIN